jgi:SAM-dependent methyltransferase
MTNVTDWDLYYRTSPVTARFSRPILFRRFLATLQRYSVANPSLAELGGAGSHVFDEVRHRLGPREYHVIDNNQYGLDLLSRRVRGDPNVSFWNRSVLRLDLPLELDTVFSLGLIEHFDEEGTREAILAHLRLLKPGGIAIISFPTPTLLYRAARGIAKVAGKWIFHDERPLWPDEVRAVIDGQADWLHGELVWPIMLTQTLAAIRKRGAE